MCFDGSNDSLQVTNPRSLAAGVLRSSSAPCNKAGLFDRAKIDVMGGSRQHRLGRERSAEADRLAQRQGGV